MKEVLFFGLIPSLYIEAGFGVLFFILLSAVAFSSKDGSPIITSKRKIRFFLLNLPLLMVIALFCELPFTCMVALFTWISLIGYCIVKSDS